MGTRAGGRVGLTSRGTVDGETRVDPSAWEAHRALAGKPQIVVGGPGTGKTQFLCDRVVEALATGAVSADQVIMLAFSRQGANDIRSRLFDALGGDAYRVNVSTYHSLAMRLIESHATDLGWSAPPSVLAGAEQEHFVAGLLVDEDKRAWHAAFQPILDTQQMAAEVTDFLLRCHEHLLGPADVAAHGRDQWRGIPEFFDRYLVEQTEAGRTDYGRILADAVAAVETWPDVAAPYRLVVADEYQDSSPAQARLLLGLAANTLDLLVAADPYQSMYSFRGADLSNVFDFPEATLEALGVRAERLVLTTSHRVPAEILSSAVAVTGRELPGGAGKVLSTRSGGSVAAHVFPLEVREAAWIAADIERVHIKEGVPLERIAVFIRTASAFTDELIRALDRTDIPHTYEDGRLADEPIVRFVRDLVSAATTQDADDTAIRRVLQGPYVGVSAGAMIGIDTKHAAGQDWAELVASEIDGGAPLAQLLSDSSWSDTDRAPAGLWHVWVTLPHLAALVTDDARAGDLRAWSAFAQALERLEDRSPHATLLDHEQLVGHSDFEADPLFEFRTPTARGVTVTTLHRSKGTDFDVVYIANAVEGALPDLRTTDSILGSRHLNPHLPTDAGEYRAFRLDEERRLAYTAMTRASSKVVWTATSSDEVDGSIASRFLPLVAPVTPSSHETAPLTPRSFEASLRRSLNDPLAIDVDRLAAAVVLAKGAEIGLADPLTRYGTLESGSNGNLVPSDLRMSPSQAGSYTDCPRRYAVDRYLMTQSDETDYMRFGTLIHQVLEGTEREASAGGSERSTAADAIVWLARLWDEYGFGDDAVGLAWRRRAETMLEDMYRLWPSSARPVDFETPLSLVVGDTPWFGKADRIEATEDGVSIVDYKTGGVVSVPEAAESIQLGYYAMAAAENPEVTTHGEVVGAEFWYPRELRKHSIATRHFDMDNLDAVRETMIEIATAIRAEEFDPVPGKRCSSCHIELVCPARSAGQGAFT